MRAGPLLVGVVCLIAAACGNGNSSTTSTTAPTTTTLGSYVETFTGTLTAGSTKFYSFTNTQAGTVSLMLASLTSGGPSPALSTTVRFGMGIPQGTGCGLLTSADTRSGLSAQLSYFTPPGIYCVSVADLGALPAPADFLIRITHP